MKVELQTAVFVLRGVTYQGMIVIAARTPVMLASTALVVIALVVQRNTLAPTALDWNINHYTASRAHLARDAISSSLVVPVNIVRVVLTGLRTTLASHARPEVIKIRAVSLAQNAIPARA